MNTYTKIMRLAGWAAVALTPVVIITGNAITGIMDPTACPIGLVCTTPR
jgi:heme A synthase